MYEFHALTPSSFHSFYLLLHIQSHTCQFNRKVKQSLGGNNACKKIVREGYELGYLDFTLSLTTHLPHPNKKNGQFPSMHNRNKNNTQGEANLWCIRTNDPSRSRRWHSFAKYFTHHHILHLIHKCRIEVSLGVSKESIYIISEPSKINLKSSNISCQSRPVSYSQF